MKKKSLLPDPVKKVKFEKEELEKLLEQYFGHSGFRGKQLDAIQAVLSGRDCFCLMPTGGGKSMCFQIPALAKPGIVLVISPLIALMEDQVATLKKKKISAEFLSSTQTAHTKEKIYEDLNSGKPSIKLLYVTPELVALNGFRTTLAKLYDRGLLSLIAIDEAHCISTWGHDFRPSYRKLSSLRSRLQNVPILALTATAVPKVEKDVIESLNLHHPTVLRASFNRANIFYEVRYKDLLNNAYDDLSNLIKSKGSVCSIIYCLERSTCDDLSGHLSKNGIPSAGLNNKMRSTVLDSWLSSKIQVVVATVAFGMGIDKEDVRFVCHFNVPKSMEGFYQESGRAGRDQLPSRSVLYYGLDDRRRMEFILSNSGKKQPQSSGSSNSLPNKSLADFKQMVEYCEGTGCRRRKILESFGEQVTASLCQKTCDACKHPSLVSTKVGELKCLPSSHRNGGLAPVFIKSSFIPSSDCEYWNRDDEASFSDEDISNSDDEADAISSVVKSRLSSKAGLDEKFEALQRAEEAYYQNNIQKKSSGLPDKKVISETLREASKKRLLNALNLAQERLGQKLPATEESSTFLETECFKKYEKVGKTFYNSQVAATIRWLSSSSCDQICNRLGSNHSLASSTKSPEDCPSDSKATSWPLPDFTNPKGVESDRSKEKTHETDQLFTSTTDQLCMPSNSLQSEIPKDKIELPPIPSFAEFANKNSKAGSKDHLDAAAGAQKRALESYKHGRSHSEKKMKRR